MLFITPNQGARTFPEIKIRPLYNFFFFFNIFTCPIRHVAPKFYLPHLNFLLAPGKRAMLNVEPCCVWLHSPRTIYPYLPQMKKSPPALHSPHSIYTVHLPSERLNQKAITNGILRRGETLPLWELRPSLFVPRWNGTKSRAVKNLIDGQSVGGGVHETCNTRWSC